MDQNVASLQLVTILLIHSSVLFLISSYSLREISPAALSMLLNFLDK